ncbi:hypothetical protein I2750_22250 [Bacillus sp. PR5]|nr:hypothetical protein [Bacillus sp. PR5]
MPESVPERVPDSVSESISADPLSGSPSTLCLTIASPRFRAMECNLEMQPWNAGIPKPTIEGEKALFARDMK